MLVLGRRSERVLEGVFGGGDVAERFAGDGLKPPCFRAVLRG